jgi:dTDP-4-amino-4,6-dideoxygalactose transaminase
VTTNNPELSHTIRTLRDWGAERKYIHTLKGYNYRLESLQGAILNVKMRYIEDWTEARRSHAALYDALLSGVVQTPKARRGARHVYHVYAIRTIDRDTVQSALKDNGINTGIHYPIPVHLQPAHADLGGHAGDFPHAEAASREVLSLPMYAEIDDRSIQYVADEVRSAVLTLSPLATAAGA